MRVNDIFSMCIVRTLQKRPNIRISMGAMKLVEEYGAWFIQFPTFSYIRVQGFSTKQKQKAWQKKKAQLQL